MPFRLVGSVGRSAGRTGMTAEDDADDEPVRAGESVGEPAVVIRGKRREGAAADDDDHEQNGEKEIPVTAAVAKSEESATEESSETAEEETPKTPQSKRGFGARLASALRIRNLGKNDQQEMLDELDAAANRGDEVIDYQLPSLDLLLAGESVHLEEHEKEVRLKAKMLEKTFANFGFKVKVVEIETGPVIAQYEVELEAGLRLSKITGLADDLAIALRVPSVRIVAPIPGKNTVGIEVPNNDRQLVRLREVIEETNGRVKKMSIPLYLGKDVAGNPMVVDLATLPHLLIAGRTGTGKSVCLNSIIVSMLMTRSPNDVRMLMIDPKMVELSPYKKLPHLMHPVVTDMRKAEAILAWAVEKMEERYALLARAGVRHISVYNQLGEEELMDRLQPETDEERGRHSAAPAVHRDRGRRNRRPDDDRRQRSRTAHHPPGAKEPGGRHPPGAGHAKADGRCHHRPDQIELAGPHLLPSCQPHRQPRGARRNGGRKAARQRRHAVPAPRHQHAAARPGHVCER